MTEQPRTGNESRISSRDWVVSAVANFVLRFASKHYRDMIGGSIQYGLRSAARDATEGRPAPEPWEVLAKAASVTSLACECGHRSNQYRYRGDGYWHCSDCDGRVEEPCAHEYEYLEREPGETYTGFCEKCIKCGDVVQVPQ